MTREVLEQAWQLTGIDFEDDLQVACAEAEILDAIVTRDGEDFRGATILVPTPGEARQKLLLE